MADLHLVIGNKSYSSWSLRPWIAMKAQGLAFRETVIGLQRPETTAEIKAYSAAGKVQEQAGKVTGNADQEARGHAREMEGKAQKKVGDLKEAAKDVVRKP